MKVTSTFKHNILLMFYVLASISCKSTDGQFLNSDHLDEDLTYLLNTLEEEYIYFKDKGIDIECLTSQYNEAKKNLSSNGEVVLLFEYLLDEFYDSHLILNTNTKASYRLYSPIYTNTIGAKTYIKNVWISQISKDIPEIIGAEIIALNGKVFDHCIKEFPTLCQDKTNDEIRTWVGNKILAGRYNEPRNLLLKLKTGETQVLNLDSLYIRQDSGLLHSEQRGAVGIIRINNSLGEEDLVKAFDAAMDSLMETNGLILDLRNTVDGGNTSVAKPIMGRFISKKSAYQIHQSKEKRWTEYVESRKKTYVNKLIVIVNRWTGSMGEGMAIGLEGMERAIVIGTEMERLAGAMQGYNFKNRKYGFRISTEKLFHINGIAREKYVPTEYVEQKTVLKDEILEKAISLINNND